MVKSIFVFRRRILLLLIWSRFLFRFLFELVYYGGLAVYLSIELGSLEAKTNWHFYAIFLVLAWVDFLSHIRSLQGPQGIYVTMLVKVIAIMIKVLFVFMILILGFALTFHLLVDNQQFKTVGLSIMKVFTMLAGELEFKDVIGVDSETTTVKPTVEIPTEIPTEITSFILLCFLVIMTLAVMNLMIGLAVGEIREIKSEAEKNILQVSYF